MRAKLLIITSPQSSLSLSPFNDTRRGSASKATTTKASTTATENAPKTISFCHSNL